MSSVRHKIIPPIYFLAAIFASVGLHYVLPLASPINLFGGRYLEYKARVRRWL